MTEIEAINTNKEVFAWGRKQGVAAHRTATLHTHKLLMDNIMSLLDTAQIPNKGLIFKHLFVTEEIYKGKEV